MLSLTSSAQNSTYKVEGYLYKHNTSVPVANAIIKVNHQVTHSQENGYFELFLLQGKHQIIVTHLSFDTLSTIIVLNKNLQLPLYLSPRSTSMTEITITGSKKTAVENLSPNVQTLTKTDLDKLPAFLGQRDPIKALQTLPGTGKGGEGNSGFYVRGGTSGQNLTLLNDAVIYNPSHLLGFFSVFNNSAVENVNLYKSGIPAEYGGRLSSVIAINSSKAISDSLSIEGDLSLLSASTSIDIPVSNNWSVTTTARKTFMNYTVWPLLNSLGFSSSAFNNMKYDFHDLNLTSNARINKNNYLHFSAYTGSDDFGFNLNKLGIRNTMDWQNTALALNWKKLISDRAILNTTATFSNYKFNFGMQQNEFQAGVSSKIKDYNLKSILSIYLKKHYLKTGFQYTSHNFKPNTPFASSVDTDYDFGVPNIYHSDESSVFISDEFNISDKSGIYADARLTYYRHNGPYKIVNDDKTEVSYTKNELVSSFIYLEPSITFKQLISSNSSIKLSFSRNVQPVHLISVTAVNFPADFWMPTLNSLPPEKGYQASLGYFKNIGGSYEAYIDTYYKNMKGLVEFSGGVMNLIDNLKIEENLLYGSGEAYGSEFFIKKKTGKLTGWIGYTLSKSNRNFDLINNGQSFPAKYDRRHDLSLVSNYAINNKWNVSGSFTYATGNAYTRPTSRYMISGNIINEYGSFNGSRMPSYHRMDIAATYQLKKRKNYSQELSVSVYNIYNRKNPIYIYFLAEGNIEEQRVQIQPKSVNILPVLPSISYRFVFK
ncbi:MAG: TonB-dependent receptor [Sphingobacteriaceae bacterium]